MTSRLMPARDALRASRVLSSFRMALVAALPLLAAWGCTTDPARDEARVTNAGPSHERLAPALSSAIASTPVTLDAVCVDNGAGLGVGDGSDGIFAPLVSLTVANPKTTATATSGTTTITVGSSLGFLAGNLVLLHQTQGAGAGTWETARITAIAPTSITVALPLAATYVAGAQLVKIFQYTDVTINAGVAVSAPAWNGTTGGIVAFVANGTVTINGTISADGAGFRGGAGDGGGNGCPGTPKAGFQGEGSAGASARSTAANGNGGGGGGTLATFCCSNCPPTPGTTGDSGGGGGGYGTAGGTGQGSATPGVGGAAVGAADLTSIFLGGGGGGGGGNCGQSSPPGANGGGIVFVTATTLVANAAGSFVRARGNAAGVNSPTNWEGGGGGGAGGALEISARTLTLKNGALDATGGAGSVQCAGQAGNGGVGRVRITCGTLNGAACPANGAAVSSPAPNVTAFCSFATCTSSAECPAAQPVCDAASRQCVQCTSNANCVGNVNGPLCDLTKHTCGACTSGNLAACVNRTPTCDTSGAFDVCAACTGNFGAVTARPCPTAGSPACLLAGGNSGACVQCATSADCSGATPVCNASNVCVACNGDNGTAATQACPTSINPHCNLATGVCNKCASDADCGAGHAGPFCNVASGACGNTCFTDAECGAGNWCNDVTAGGVCQPKVTNGQPVPGGTCTVVLGGRACATSVCDTDNNCGYLNGDGPCVPGPVAAVCRSGVCDADSLCGYRNNFGPCAGNAARCRSAACDPDGNCGFKNGDGPCNGANGGVVCRSLVCATSGPNNGLCEQCNGDPNCGGVTPACNTTTSTCVQCTAGNRTACVGTTPICNTAASTCVACNGDNGTAATFSCPVVGNPWCSSTGACAKCTTNGDCTGNHPGPLCNTTTGACGNTCTLDTDCASTQWCSSGTCTAKTPNGQPLPAVSPINGTCTVANGARVCVSGVCEASDNRCGYANGDGPCTGSNGGVVCRSTICATSGANAGKCEQCIDDSACSGTTPVCDTTTNACVQCIATKQGACTGTTPVCGANDTCGPCARDNGLPGAGACPSGTAPYCKSGGDCGKCATNADCTGSTHGGPLCDPTSGACGNACKLDSDCSATQWCTAPQGGTGACVPKLDNGVPLPTVPPGLSICSDPIGARVCVSGVCDTKDNKCGRADGDACTKNGECRTGQCKGNLCGNAAPDGGATSDGGGTGADASFGVDSGGGGGNPEAPNDNGSLEGGGCSTAPGGGGAGAPALLMALGLAVGLSRRRKRR